MKFHRIYALSIRHLYVIKGSFPRILESDLLANNSNNSLGIYFTIFHHV